MLSASFDMQIHEYNEKRIELRAESNWNIILRNNILLSIAVFVVGAVVYSVYTDFYLFVFMFWFFFVIFMLKKINEGKGASYIKEQIVFDRSGITLKHDLQAKDKTVFRKKSLQSIQCVQGEACFKFYLNGQSSASFEFCLRPYSKDIVKTILADILGILDFKITSNLKLFNNKIIEAVPNNIDGRDKQELDDIMLPKLGINAEDYEKISTAFELIDKGDELVIKSKNKGFFSNQLPRIVLSREKKIIHTKPPLLIGTAFGFDEMQELKYSVRFSPARKTPFVIGELFICTKTEKLITILMVKSDLYKDKALIQLDFHKALKSLIVLLQQQIARAAASS